MIQVVRAKKSDEAALDNLLQLYLLEFSEIDGSQPSNDGRFEYPHLGQYWDEPDCHAFLFEMEGSLAGFALIKRGSEIANDSKSMDVAEFFVLHAHRRKGVGRAAFGDIVRMFPGPWIVRVLEEYETALAFWRHTLPAVANAEFDRETMDDGQRKWIVFSFESGGSDSTDGIVSPSLPV